MSRTISFEVSDELYEAFEQVATRSGRAADAVALEWIARHAPQPRPVLTEEEARRARAKLSRYAGAADSGDSRSADNDRIDADLAREYEAEYKNKG